MANVLVEATVSSHLLGSMLHCSNLHFESLDPELETEGISRTSICTDVLYLTLYTKVCTDVTSLILYNKVCTDMLYLTLYTKVCTEVPYLTLYTNVCNSICSCNTFLPLQFSVTFKRRT